MDSWTPFDPYDTCADLSEQTPHIVPVWTGNATIRTLALGRSRSDDLVCSSWPGSDSLSTFEVEVMGDS
jgi:hypothetical protein